MTRRNWIARTRLASGRFLFTLLAAATIPGGCQQPPGPRVAGPPAFPDPVLAPGPLSPSREARAADLYRQAREALDAGNASRAQALTAEVVQLHPQSPVSGVALLLYARASLDLGTLDAADEAAGRFAGLVSPGDPRESEARLLQARVQERRGNEAARLARLLQIPDGAPAALVTQAVDAAREAAGRVDGTDLERLLGEAPVGGVVRPVVLARYAAVLFGAGRASEASRAAQAALDAGAASTDSVTAAAVLAGRGVEGVLPGGASRRATLGAVLPLGGSPAFREFATSVAEGIEVAAATFPQGVTVEVVSLDDQGDPALAGAAVTELERSGALGAIGFLEEGSLDAAADRRTGIFPLVSPTSRTARGEGTYTLSGADPQAAVAMARYAAREGFRRVAVIHSRSSESQEEAEAFEGALRSLGVPMAGRFAYDAGATYFQEPIAAAQEALRGAEIRALGLGPEDTLRVEMLEPVALFVPVPAEDVELLAPQLTFFGLDTLAIRILGTSGWTDNRTLGAVDNRHTTGVVATTPVDGGPGTPGYMRFRQAYERHFQRTLVSPVPALGYDAALLLLAGLQEGARSPSQLRAAVERVRDLEGATGSFSVVGGRVVRRTQVVRIEHGTLIPAY